MIRFNDLLIRAGIDPAVTRLVRHRHRTRQRQLYVDAIRRIARFEEYQALQSNSTVIRQLGSAEVLASFAVDPAGDTVFVGLWHLRGYSPAQAADPYNDGVHFQGQPPFVRLDLARAKALDAYVGRIVVDWGKGERAWVQYAERRDKEVVELRKRVEEPLFPGFGTFRCALHEVDALPLAWIEVLRSTRGVYLLVHRDTGAQYVGSAVGSDGILGRWRGYVGGHGGNVAMRELGRPADEYDASVLDTVGYAATAEEVYALETSWKVKLGSRAQGLNRN
jgi:hypothetical protein